MYVCRDATDPYLQIQLIENDEGFENNKFEKVSVQLSKFSDDEDVSTELVYAETGQTADIVISGGYKAFEGKYYVFNTAATFCYLAGENVGITLTAIMPLLPYITAEVLLSYV